jgi:hypothetical protein
MSPACACAIRTVLETADRLRSFIDLDERSSSLTSRVYAVQMGLSPATSRPLAVAIARIVCAMVGHIHMARPRQPAVVTATVDPGASDNASNAMYAVRAFIRNVAEATLSVLAGACTTDSADVTTYWAYGPLMYESMGMPTTRSPTLASAPVPTSSTVPLKSHAGT